MSENIIIRDRLAASAEKAIDEAYRQAKDMPDSNGNHIDERTRLLNVQNFLGKWWAYMGLLEDISLDTWVDLLEKTDDQRRVILDFSENIYKYEPKKRRTRKAAS